MRDALTLSLVVAAVVADGLAGVQRAAAQGTSIERGILGDWEAKPFTWRTGEVKGCRYRQIITIGRKIGPGRFTGSYKARTTCVAGGWNLKGRITVDVKGTTVTITGSTKHWIVETVRYLNPYRMEGKDAQGHPMIYVRPKALPNS